MPYFFLILVALEALYLGLVGWFALPAPIPVVGVFAVHLSLLLAVPFGHREALRYARALAIAAGTVGSFVYLISVPVFGLGTVEAWLGTPLLPVFLYAWWALVQESVAAAAARAPWWQALRACLRALQRAVAYLAGLVRVVRTLGWRRALRRSPR
jgi:hypothetical protein